MLTRQQHQRGLSTGIKVIIFLVILGVVVNAVIRLATPKIGFNALISVMDEQARFGQVKTDEVVRTAIMEVAKKHNIPIRDPEYDIRIRRNYPKPGDMEIAVRPYKKTVDLIIYKKEYIFKPKVSAKMGRGLN